jgi:hypothetical protein
MSLPPEKRTAKAVKDIEHYDLAISVWKYFGGSDRWEKYHPERKDELLENMEKHFISRVKAGEGIKWRDW